MWRENVERRRCSYEAFNAAALHGGVSRPRDRATRKPRLDAKLAEALKHEVG
jgi:hypothetical protein